MDKSNSKSSGLIAMLVVVTIYGLSYLVRAVITDYMHTAVIVGLQMAIITILFSLYNIIKKVNMKIDKKDIFMICLSGLFGTTLFHGFTILSVTEIGATVSSLLFGFAAVFSLIIDIVFFKRKKQN